jgi:hypothetical protein
MTLIFLAWAAFGLAQGGDKVPKAERCQRLVIVMPRDEWRLTVARDGSAWINYAALPQTARSAAGTFRFATVYSELKGRVRRSCSGGLQGDVEFALEDKTAPSSSWCITDEAYVAALFERVWVRVEHSPNGPERNATLRSMWSRRTAPIRRP